MVIGDLLIQTAAYAAVIGVTIFIFGMLQRGYFFKYFTVRTSFGRKFMVKIRSPLTDYFEVGHFDQGFIVFKHNKQELRLSIRDGSGFYKCQAVNWIDIDEESGAICTVDYKPITGFDPVKFSDLLTRALMKPAIESNKEKIMFLAMIGIGIGVLVAIGLGYMNYMKLNEVLLTIPQTISAIQ